MLCNTTSSRLCSPNAVAFSRHSIICTRQDELGNEAKVITIIIPRFHTEGVQPGISSQFDFPLNFRLKHCVLIIIDSSS